jgi:hypothetical protein
VVDLLSSAGLTLAATALAGMVIGVVMATSGAVTRRRRMGATGARLLLAGPGLTTIGMGIYVVGVGLPWPAALIALLPIVFGGLLLWAAVRTSLGFAGRP